MGFNSFYKRNKDLIIELDTVVLEIKNAKVLKCENKGYENRFLKHSEIAKAELLFKDGKFILEIIIESQEKSINIEYWYLTVVGEDIIADPESDFGVWKGAF